eukprot:802616-Rhodomonas_salina.1
MPGTDRAYGTTREILVLAQPVRQVPWYSFLCPYALSGLKEKDEALLAFKSFFVTVKGPPRPPSSSFPLSSSSSSLPHCYAAPGSKRSVPLAGTLPPEIQDKKPQFQYNLYQEC